MRRVALAVVFGLLAASGVRAQGALDGGLGELVTDRPDFTESSAVIGAGLFQFESGFNYERGGDERTVTVPGALLRIGVGHRTEVRLGTDGVQAHTVGAQRVVGRSDFEVGAKIKLFEQDQMGVDMSVIPMMSLPTGQSGFTSGGVDPTVKITWARSMPAGFDMTGNFNFASVTDGTGRYGQRAVSVSVGHDLPAGFGGFVEMYGFNALEKGGPAATTMDWGISRLIAQGVQVDVEVGRGVSSGAADWFMGFGFAVKRKR